MVNTNFQKVPFTVLLLMAVAQLTHLAPVIAIFVWVDSSFSIALATYLLFSLIPVLILKILMDLKAPYGFLFSLEFIGHFPFLPK